MVFTKSYVHEPEPDVLRIGDYRISLESVIYPYLRGDTPEQIIDQFPVLRLEEVYGAIAFYLANREEVDSYLRRQEERWEQLRKEQDDNPPPVVQRLRALRQATSRESA